MNVSVIARVRPPAVSGLKASTGMFDPLRIKCLDTVLYRICVSSHADAAANTLPCVVSLPDRPKTVAYVGDRLGSPNAAVNPDTASCYAFDGVIASEQPNDDVFAATALPLIQGIIPVVLALAVYTHTFYIPPFACCRRCSWNQRFPPCVRPNRIWKNTHNYAPHPSNCKVSF